MLLLRLAAGLILVLLVSGGCRSDGPVSDGPFYPPASAAFLQAPPDSVLELLRAADATGVRAAFAALDRIAYTRTTETVQLGPGGEAVATHELTLRHAAGADSSELIGEARSGTFALGWTSRLFGRSVSRTAPADLGRHALPEEPAYLSARGREAYTYRLLPDTTIGGRRTTVVDVALRPNTTQSPTVRHARLYLDASTYAVLALDITRASTSAFFDQVVRTRLQLQPAPDGERWLPATVRTRTRFDGALTQPQQLETTSTFTSLSAGATPSQVRPSQVRGERIAAHQARE